MRETDALVDLYVDGEVISTTGEHPFWVPDKGWVEAKDLVVGSLLQTGDGRIVDVDRVQKREGPFEVYNFKVEGIPTYFVSELGVLVHNANYLPIPQANDSKLTNLVNYLYKGASMPNPIGSGSTADAIREEIATGQAVYGKFHTTKGKEAITALDKWLTNNPKASHQDRLIAQSMRDDLQKALNGQ